MSAWNGLADFYMKFSVVLTENIDCNVHLYKQYCWIIITQVGNDVKIKDKSLSDLSSLPFCPRMNPSLYQRKMTLRRMFHVPREHLFHSSLIYFELTLENSFFFYEFIVKVNTQFSYTPH